MQPVGADRPVTDRLRHVDPGVRCDGRADVDGVNLVDGPRPGPQELHLGAGEDRFERRLPRREVVRVIDVPIVEEEGMGIVAQHDFGAVPADPADQLLPQREGRDQLAVPVTQEDDPGDGIRGIPLSRSSPAGLFG